MQHDAYIKLAEVTLSPEFHCTSTDGQQLLHAAMGLQTEVGELMAADNKVGLLNSYWLFDRVNFAEEIGDALWYLTIPERLLALNLAEQLAACPDQRASSKYLMCMPTPTRILQEINQDTVEFLDMMKKGVFYNRPLNLEKLRALLLDVYEGLVKLVTLLQLDIEQIQAKNIQKLNARYGDKFSSFLANNRDLEKEFAILAK